tara:strand:+ start:37761 stop:37964 length:204 start_codon:yes stop_codon:yes gene_type:complete
MSTLAQKITHLLLGTQSMAEAVQILTSHYPQLSVREAENTVKDIIDYGNQKMKESELEYWLKGRGIA